MFIYCPCSFALDWDMDVYATLQKSRLCPHFKRNCTFWTAPFHNFVARAFSYSHPEKPGSWSIAHSLNMLLQVLITFTIVFVFFTIVTVSCCIPFSVFLFPLHQAFEVFASACSPRRALVLLLILRPKRQGFGKSWNERRAFRFSLLLCFLLLRSLISVEGDLLSFAACKGEIQGLVMFSISKDFSILMAPANMDFQTPLWIWCEVTMVTFKLLGASALVRGSGGDSSVLLHQPAGR